MNHSYCFLNYKFGAYEENPDRKDGEEVKFIPYDDTGIHTYTITEKSIDKAGIKCDTSTFKVYVDVQPSKKADGTYEYDTDQWTMKWTVEKLKVYSFSADSIIATHTFEPALTMMLISTKRL